MTEENPDSDLTFDNERFAPERKHPYDDLTFRDGANKERIAYAKGEDEPFTGVGVSTKTQRITGMGISFFERQIAWQENLF